MFILSRYLFCLPYNPWNQQSTYLPTYLLLLVVAGFFRERALSSNYRYKYAIILLWANKNVLFKWSIRGFSYTTRLMPDSRRVNTSPSQAAGDELPLFAARN